MERRYAVAVLVVGMGLFLGASTIDTGLSRLGLFLVVAVGGALLVDDIRQHRSAGRKTVNTARLRAQLRRWAHN
jgi:hypothetical protein